MKKVLSLLMVLVMCLTVVGCSDGTKETTQTETEKVTDSTKAESETAREAKEVGVGEAFQVDTEYGSYVVTVTGISKTDWWERAKKNTDKTVILVEYEVENIDFSMPSASGVAIDSRSFKISDSENYLLSSFSMRYDSITPGQVVEPGYKMASSIPYILDRETEYCNVVFTRSDGDVAKVKVEM